MSDGNWFTKYFWRVDGKTNNMVGLIVGAVIVVVSAIVIYLTYN